MSVSNRCQEEHRIAESFSPCLRIRSYHRTSIKLKCTICIAHKRFTIDITKSANEIGASILMVSWDWLKCQSANSSPIDEPFPFVLGTEEGKFSNEWSRSMVSSPNRLESANIMMTGFMVHKVLRPNWWLIQENFSIRRWLDESWSVLLYQRASEIRVYFYAEIIFTVSVVYY